MVFLYYKKKVHQGGHCGKAPVMAFRFLCYVRIVGTNQGPVTDTGPGQGGNVPREHCIVYIPFTILTTTKPCSLLSFPFSEKNSPSLRMILSLGCHGEQELNPVCLARSPCFPHNSVPPLAEVDFMGSFPVTDLSTWPGLGTSRVGCQDPVAAQSIPRNLSVS